MVEEDPQTPLQVLLAAAIELREMLCRQKPMPGDLREKAQIALRQLHALRLKRTAEALRASRS
jgi:hypothetical protein